jgi:hypothetical protein
MSRRKADLREKAGFSSPSRRRGCSLDELLIEMGQKAAAIGALATGMARETNVRPGLVESAVHLERSMVKPNGLGLRFIRRDVAVCLRGFLRAGPASPVVSPEGLAT